MRLIISKRVFAYYLNARWNYRAREFMTAVERAIGNRFDSFRHNDLDQRFASEKRLFLDALDARGNLDYFKNRTIKERFL